jgi:hypothetical protein
MRSGSKLHVLSLQFSQFRVPQPGLHRQLQQLLIPAAQPGAGIRRVDKCRGFFAAQELHGASVKTLERHRQNALTVGCKSRLIEANIPKESVDGAQTIVAAASAVAAILFEMLEKRAHQFGIQVFHLQIAGVATVMFGSKFEQQSEGISITGDGVGAGAQLSQQSVGKEPL